MTIHQFSTQPCPDCKRDTTHHQMACRECGHRNVSNAEAYLRTRGHLMASNKSHLFRAARSIHARAQRDKYRAMPGDQHGRIKL